VFNVSDIDFDGIAFYKKVSVPPSFWLKRFEVLQIVYDLNQNDQIVKEF